MNPFFPVYIHGDVDQTRVHDETQVGYWLFDFERNHAFPAAILYFLGDG